MRVLLLAAAAALSISAPVLAQDEDAVQVEDACLCNVGIYVLGEGLPDTPGTPAYSTVEIDREAILATASGRLEDALSHVAGFQQFRRSDSRSANATAQGATLRAISGNATSRALVLLDGVPVADPFFGYIPFSSMAPERLQSIRVTRGGGSGPFGAGALAGTIELTSADAAHLGLVAASALTNARGDSELSASLAPQLGDGFAMLHARWDRGEGFFTTPEDQRVPASSRANFDSWSAGGRLVQRLGDVELQVRALAFEDKRTLRFEGADNSSQGQDVSLRAVSRGPWQVDALAYAQWRNFSNVVISSTRFVRVLDQKDTPSSGRGGKLEIRPPLGDAHVLRIGADYRRSEGDLFEDAYSAFTGQRTQERFAGGANSDLGLFAEHDWQAAMVTLTGGVRADRYSIRNGYFRAIDADGSIARDDSFTNRSDWELSWRAGALLSPNDVLTVRVAAYSGFRLPTLNELYRPFVVFPVVTQANAALAPERMEGWELGLDLAPAEGVALSATWFDNRVEDAIANVTIDANLRQRRNLDAIEARGVEATAALDRGPFGLHGTLVVSDAKAVGSGFAAPLDGNRPSQSPAFAASLTAAYAIVEEIRVSATLRHVGKQFEGDRQDDALPAVTTLDLFGQVQLTGRLSLVGRVENLFDETLVTRNQSGSIDLGAPRTMWLGLRWGH